MAGRRAPDCALGGDGKLAVRDGGCAGRRAGVGDALSRRHARAGCSAGVPVGHADHSTSRLAADRIFAGLFATRWDCRSRVRIFLTVGICGGYTTFSTFALDAFYLIERGEAAAAGAYAIASVVLSVAALVAAMHLVRALP